MKPGEPQSKWATRGKRRRPFGGRALLTTVALCFALLAPAGSASAADWPWGSSPENERSAQNLARLVDQAYRDSSPEERDAAWREALQAWALLEWTEVADPDPDPLFAHLQLKRILELADPPAPRLGAADLDDEEKILAAEQAARRSTRLDRRVRPFHVRGLDRAPDPGSIVSKGRQQSVEAVKRLVENEHPEADDIELAELQEHALREWLQMRRPKIWVESGDPPQTWTGKKEAIAARRSNRTLDNQTVPIALPGGEYAYVPRGTKLDVEAYELVYPDGRRVSLDPTQNRADEADAAAEEEVTEEDQVVTENLGATRDASTQADLTLGTSTSHPLPVPVGGLSSTGQPDLPFVPGVGGCGGAKNPLGGTGSMVTSQSSYCGGDRHLRRALGDGRTNMGVAPTLGTGVGVGCPAPVSGRNLSTTTCEPGAALNASLVDAGQAGQPTPLPELPELPDAPVATTARLITPEVRPETGDSEPEPMDTALVPEEPAASTEPEPVTATVESRVITEVVEAVVTPVFDDSAQQQAATRSHAQPVDPRIALGYTDGDIYREDHPEEFAQPLPQAQPAPPVQPEINLGGTGRIQAADPSLSNPLATPDEPNRGPQVIQGGGFGFLID